MRNCYKPRRYARRKAKVGKAMDKVELRQRMRQGAINQALFGDRLFSEKPFNNHEYANDRAIL